MKVFLFDCEIKILFFYFLLLLSFLISVIFWKGCKEQKVWISFLSISVLFEFFINKYFIFIHVNNSYSNNFYIIIIAFFYLLIFKESLNIVRNKFTELIPFVYLILSLSYIIISDLAILHVGPYLVGLTISSCLLYTSPSPRDRG